MTMNNGVTHSFNSIYITLSIGLFFIGVNNVAKEVGKKEIQRVSGMKRKV